MNYWFYLSEMQGITFCRKILQKVCLMFHNLWFAEYLLRKNVNDSRYQTIKCKHLKCIGFCIQYNYLEYNSVVMAEIKRYESYLHILTMVNRHRCTVTAYT